MDIAKKIAVSAVALSIACVECMAAVSVTASRDYVDRKTSVSVVTNDNVEGYRIGSNANFTFATHSALTGLINSIPGMIQEEDPLVGLTNGTIHIKGSSITPLTSFTETDPTVPAWAKVTTPPYLTSYTETDPNVPAWAKVSNPPYLTSYTETDPTVPSWAKVTTPPYLTSFTESDPTVPAWAKELNPPESVSQSVVTQVVQRIVSVTSSYIWDNADECLYRVEPSNGFWYLDPVTNVNALLPENTHILQYLEEHKYDNN